MSKDYNYEIGYETLQSEWKLQCKRTPRGVTLVKGGNNIYLQFKTPNTTTSKYKCSGIFSIDGMHEAVRKSNLVKAKLTSMTSEVEFWEWYKKEIEEDSQLIDDRITFGEAIKKVEDDFWSRPDRRKQTRDKNNASHQSSWRETYGRFYSYLPSNKVINLDDIHQAISRQQTGSRSFKYSLSAMKKLCRMNKNQKLIDALDEINTIQTKHHKLETINLEDFLAWRTKVLSSIDTDDKRFNPESRKAWIYVFSLQVAYGLRISEVFAIKNLFTDWVTPDGVPIPALSNLSNNKNLIYVGSKTNIGTTVKTGSRLARPNIRPKYPNLLEMLDIKNPMMPECKPKTKNTDRIRSFYSSTATKILARWNAPTTQTHAFRHLANINGIQAGIPQEVRAQSMGHTVQMNESVYKKRQSTQTTIDLLLNSNSNAIDFVTALAEAKKLVAENESDKQVIARLLSIIYHKDSKTINKLL